MDRRSLLLLLAGLCAGSALTLAILRLGRGGALPPAGGPSAGSPPRLAMFARFAERVDASTFQKGNIHTHSTESDGDSPPEAVLQWYRDHGYAFVAMTEHNKLLDLTPYRGLERTAPPGFALITGEEITMWVRGLPVHVNALCTQRTIGGGDFPTAAEALRRAVSEVRAQGGAALVNHPNFEWALSEKDLPDARGAQLLEIWSGHPYVRTEGDLLHKSHEAMWDEALTAGEAFAGVAVDDMHHLDPAAPEAGASRPGRGFIDVFAPEATAASICDAIRHGRLYASNGARLRRLVVEGSALSVYPEALDAAVEFVGAGGAVIERARPAPSSSSSPSSSEDGAATYRLRGDELYVRARVTQPDGRRAWTQAYRVAR